MSRVTSPFVVMVLLVLAATRRRPWLVAATVVSNLLLVPAFVAQYREWRAELFTYDRQRADRVRAEIEPLLRYDPGLNAWCNTVLTTTYPREIAVVPAGIGLSVSHGPEALDGPPKSRYLLLTPETALAFGRRARLQLLASTSIGALYRNLDAACSARPDGATPARQSTR